MPYDRLEELLARRRVALLTCVLEVDAVAPVASPIVEQAIGRAAHGMERAQTPPPGADALWAGRQGDQLTWNGVQLMYLAPVRADLQRDARGAAELGGATLRRYAEALRSTAPVRFAALIVDLEFSSRDLPPVGPWLTSFVHWPVDEAADGEFRVARRDSGRFFVNWTVGAYERRQAVIPMVLGLRKVTITGAQLTDQGLRVRVDANTKVNLADNAGPIVVEDGDLERLAGLVAEATEQVPRLLAGLP